MGLEIVKYMLAEKNEWERNSENVNVILYLQNVNDNIGCNSDCAKDIQ